MAAFVPSTTFVKGTATSFFTASSKTLCPTSPAREIKYAPVDVRAGFSNYEGGATTNPSSSGPSGDNRQFKITFFIPQTSQRTTAQRKLWNIYVTKMVPFSSWYGEQQRIQKAGGKIVSVDLVSGKKQTNTGLL
mmetsp:Transcript_38300/g.63573  ORF Transcript_38300/g.63573 Transcript_38300/m.63573 type:complete len:134 (+) Transcript_38300:126-527(+)